MDEPYIPNDAPFSEDQRAWLSGFLAGLNSRVSVGGQTKSPSSAAEVRPLDILFGTQTGNSEALANDAAAIARGKGFHPRVSGLDAVGMEQLSSMEHLFVVISTYGEGEMPDNAQLFWDELSASTAPRLESLKFGVLALGDTSYEHFCQAGKLMDTRLEQLGASRIATRLDCDVEFEDAANQWLQTNIPDAGGGITEPEVKPVKSSWTRKKRYPAVVSDNHNLSGANSAKEIRHVAFDLGDSGIAYEVGDALGVMPVNAPDLVEAWLERLGSPFDTEIAGKDQSLGTLLTQSLEISTPPKEALQALEPLVGDQEFSHVMSCGDREELHNFLWGKDLLDILQLNPTLKIDPAELVSWLKPLQYRAYSISSSPKAHVGEVHLTVAAVRWSYNKREHRGVCSTYLADQAAVGEKVEIFPMKNKSFGIPQDNSAAMIMVGPGTGLAPFRAFLEERREIGATGSNWLFFGDQHRECDFIYEDELLAMSKSGLLTRLQLAFSRDQAEKIYVQHRMIENGRDIYAQLEEGAYFYVCGDATRMAKDVDAALHEIIATHGDKNSDDVADYVAKLKREKRYLRDVY
ncbi:MAG: sulfite reductase subunit alpha [Planctomycetaceae bacterium]|nr:sulfite reductase subunit alpha [Planctomycetaceae bacterium]